MYCIRSVCAPGTKFPSTLPSLQEDRYNSQSPVPGLDIYLIRKYIFLKRFDLITIFITRKRQNIFNIVRGDEYNSTTFIVKAAFLL